MEILNAIDNAGLSIMVASLLFGDNFDSNDETLLLSSELDLKDPLQIELKERVDDSYPEAPDMQLFQVMGRKTKFKPPKEYNRCAIYVLKDFQGVRYSRDHVEYIPENSSTKIFNMNEWIPTIPNQTLIKVNQKKTVIKNRNYKTILIWSFWK